MLPSFDSGRQSDILASFRSFLKDFLQKERLEFDFVYLLQRNTDVGTDYPLFYVGPIPSTSVFESGLWQIKAAIYVCSATASPPQMFTSSPPVLQIKLSNTL